MCANNFSGSISTLLVVLLFASPSPMSPALYLILSPTVSLFCVCFAPVFRFAMSQLCLALFLLLWWLSSFPYLVLCFVSLHLLPPVPDSVLCTSLFLPLTLPLVTSLQQTFQRHFEVAFRLVWRHGVVQRQINNEVTLYTSMLKPTTLSNVELTFSISTLI